MPAAGAEHPLAAPLVDCPSCHLALDHGRMVSGPQICPGCRKGFDAVVFQPPERTLRVAEVAASGPGGATACATHKRNAAVAHCARCGVFMCALCQVEADRLSLCPACFERLVAEGALDSARTRYRDWNGMAAGAAFLGIPFFFLGVVLGPIAVVGAVRAGSQKAELGDSSGGFAIWAYLVLGIVEFAAGLFFILSLVR